MRKKLSLFLASAMMLGCISGCGGTGKDVSVNTEAAKEAPAENSQVEITEKSEAETEAKTEAQTEASGDELKIVTTIFPEYDWVKTILGDNADATELTLLLDNGVDLHSYQPTAEDIIKIKECDMFVYVGGESDEWVEDVLEEAVNPDMKVINLLEVLGDSVKAEEIVEGMEAEEEHEHEHEDGEEHEDGDEEHEHEDGEGEEEMDEHVWLSLRNAAVICDTIGTELGELDPANADVYKNNVAAYKEELTALDKEYAAAVEAGSKKTLLFGDRFPFRYLVDDYGLDYYAAFVGCSAESEASFETIVFLAGKVDELGLGAVMTIEGPNHDIAESVKNATSSKDQVILTLDSMQSTTSADIEAGTTYLSVMKSNLDVLKEAVK